MAALESHNTFGGEFSVDKVVSLWEWTLRDTRGKRSRGKLWHILDAMHDKG